MCERAGRTASYGVGEQVTPPSPCLQGDVTGRTWNGLGCTSTTDSSDVQFKQKLQKAKNLNCIFFFFFQCRGDIQIKELPSA